MTSTMFRCGELQSSPHLPKSAEERRRRYEHLKISVAALRSRFRSARQSSPTPPSVSTLAPYSGYFSSLSPGCSNAISGKTNGGSHVHQIESNSLLESYAMQALRLDCEMKLKESQDEMQKLREKLKDKIRRTELFDRELEKQRKKLEARNSFFAEQSKLLEDQLSEQALRHIQELQAQSEAFTASRQLDEEERQKQNMRIVSNYQDTMATLKKTNEAQSAEIQKLEREYSTRLEQMEKSKQSADEHLKYLDGQLKLVSQQAETFKKSYEDQEKEWNVKLQHVTAMHQYQIKALREEYGAQIEKHKKDVEEEREQHNSRLQAYKAQKLKEMEYVEERVKGVLEAKDSTISQLKLELKTLHQQLNDSACMLDDDYYLHVEDVH